VFGHTFSGKRVLVTGHTGFKGSWLTEWLLMLGAEVTGLALEPTTEPALFRQLNLASRVNHHVIDVCDALAVRELMKSCRPDFVFHLAAQPLVRLSYSIPVETFATNVMGTVHVLEGLRDLQLAGKTCAAVMVTTDKCYENKEWTNGYREDDPMGGYDPYSASKGAAEIAIHGMRRSFFSSPTSSVRVASARAGNVIGGGDWAADRIVPDCIRALRRGSPIPVRNKTATRPWQHVLEPLSGYLLLGAALESIHSRTTPFSASISSGGAAGAAFNFGPNLSSNRTVADLVQELLKHWPGQWEDQSDPQAPHEASKLNLATDKAFHLLDWQPRWDFSTTLAKTVDWYREAESCDEAEAFTSLTLRQIHEYQEDCPG
jgi:CDP-glucose 4,6-dehydratase